MKLKFEDVLLERLKEEDIELVRQHRNSEDISQYMEYREHITPEMQKKWFDSINNNNNIYSMIYYQGKKIGLGNVKNINWDKNSMEAGIFIWDKEVQNTPVPVIGFLILGEFFIENLDLEGFAHIMKTNKRAQRFNKQIGFELCEGQEGVENQLYKLTKESYLEKAELLRKVFMKPDVKPTSVMILEKEDFDSGLADIFLSRIDEKDIIKKEETEEGLVITF